MDHRLAVRVVCCLALLTMASVSGKALPPNEPTLCAGVCPNTNDPCEPCKKLGVWTTCGQFWGHPANDLDADGVVNTNDNCQCLANANQANCDGDAAGDACDFQDNSWALISAGTNRCYLDEDDHIYQVTLEFYYRDVYQSACTGQTCYKKYLNYDIDCSPTSDLYQCCLNKAWPPDCYGAWNVDQCGLPRCQF